MGIVIFIIFVLWGSSIASSNRLAGEVFEIVFYLCAVFLALDFCTRWHQAGIKLELQESEQEWQDSKRNRHPDDERRVQEWNRYWD